MKAIYKNIALAALALSAVACTQDEDFAPSFLNDPDAVRITAQVASGNVTGGFTRSNPLGTEAEQAKFNSGDKIAVTAGTQTAVTYTFNGIDTWTPEEGKYLKWVDNSMTFNAWYPVTQGTDATTFTVPTSYADVDAMAAADYMVYSGSQSKTDGNSVTLPMKRKMARIVITPEMNDQFAEGYSITDIKVHANTSGYASGTVQAGNIEVTAFDQNGVFYALLAPTTADANATFLTVTVTKTDDSASQDLTVKGIPVTEAGKSYDYTLTVGKDKATIGNVTVADWGTSQEITGGVAEEIPYLTFSSSVETTLSMMLYEFTNDTGSNIAPLWQPFSGRVEYSIDGGDWRLLTEGQTGEFGANYGDLRLRGICPNGTVNMENGGAFAVINFTGDAEDVICSGDIRTLVNYEEYQTTSTENAMFTGLFMECTALTDASGLKLVSNDDDMAYMCYRAMFAGCTSLTSAPVLPATTLAIYCYFDMFVRCTSLTSAPVLPATTLTDYCYAGMFEGCTQLNNVTMLATDISAEDCLTEWMSGVAATGTFTKAADVDIPTGVSGIPSGWTVQE